MSTPRRIALVLGVLALTSCSNQDAAKTVATEESQALDAAVPTAPPMERRAALMAKPDMGAVAGVGAAADQSATANAANDMSSGLVPPASMSRKLLRTVELSLVVAHVDSVTQRAQDLASRLHGYTAGVNLYEQGGVPRGDVTLRVPVDRLDEALVELRSWSTRVLQEQQAVQDVTDQFVDLEARLRTLTATEHELLALLAESRRRGQKLPDILSLYRELTEIRSRIEQIQGQRDALDKLAALSTIHVQLQPTETAHPVAGTGWRPGDTVRGSARALLASLRSIADAAIVLVVAVAPVLALAGLPLWFGFRWWRRRVVRTAT